MFNPYLVGFMGAGKSAVGRALADLMGYGFLDLDAVLVERFGMPIREVFARRGEDRFREEERAALVESTGLERTVVATGGGAFCAEENRDIIHAAGGVSVFLDLPWRVLEERLGADDGERPLASSLKEARRLYESRRPCYLLAARRVSLDGGETPGEAARRVRDALVGAACAT